MKDNTPREKPYQKPYAFVVVVLAVFFAVIAVITSSKGRYAGEGDFVQPVSAATVGKNIVAVPESSGSVSINWANGSYQRIAGTASPAAGLGATNWTLTNPIDGQDYIIEFDQDANVGEAVIWPTVITGPGGATAPAIPAAIAGVEIVRLTYNGGLGKYIITGITTNAASVQSHNTCTDVMTLSSGVFSTTGAGACFLNYSRVGNFFGAGSPTAGISTPTATNAPSRVLCAQAAANSQTITCRSEDSSSSDVVTVFGIN